MIFLTPALFLRDVMERWSNTAESTEVFCDAFWRIAKPYPGAASRGSVTAKTGRGAHCCNYSLYS